MQFELDTMHIALFFTIFAITYITSTVTVQFLPQTVDKRLTMIVSSLLGGLSYLLVGPSQMIPMPDSLTLMAIGQALIGIFLGFLLIPSLPEMVESSIARFPGQERKVNDLCSGLFNAFLGFG